MDSKYRQITITLLWVCLTLLILTTEIFPTKRTQPKQAASRLAVATATIVYTPTPPLSNAEITAQLAAHFTNQVNTNNMVLIPKGPFVLGGNRDQPEEVQTSSLAAFYIDRYEVTVADYAIFLNNLTALDWSCTGINCPQMHHTLKKAMGGMAHIDGQFRPKPGYENRPITAIEWHFANLYCQWAGKRLPSSAEWEKAARGEAGWHFPWGNNWRADWASDGSRADLDIFPLPIGSHTNDISPYGVIDMLGNATEWVADPISPNEGEVQLAKSHTRRGTTAIDQKEGLTVQHQTWSVTVGFRCAYTPAPT